MIRKIIKENNFHSKEKDEVLKNFNSGKNGISNKEAKLRLQKHGPNEIPSGEKRHPVLIFIKQFHSILIYILFAAATISYFFDHIIDVYVILSVILINGIMGFIQEYKAEKAIQSLTSMIVLHAKVFREGELIQIDTKDVVPGDIIFLEEGDKIPADGRLIEAKNFRTEEAPLTGESFPVSKDIKPIPQTIGVSDRKNMVWMGTFVSGGQAKAVVTSTGISTVIGEIAKSIDEIKREKGHFERKTDRLAKQMGIIAASTSLLIFIVGFFIRDFEFEEIFLFTIASLVSGIPEGLPAILVIVLAIGVHRMAKRNAIIRRLPATETLGVVNVIATDKTGTLTQNTMNIEKIILPDKKEISVSGNGWVPSGDFFEDGNIIFPLEDAQLSKLLHISAVCNNSRLVKKNDRYEIIGDPTEASLVVLSEKAGIKKEAIKAKEKRIDDLPFNQELKYRASLSVLVEEEKKKEIYVIGAPEAILLRSNKYLSKKIEEITEEKKKEIFKQIDLLTKKAMRVLAIAYKPSPSKLTDLSDDMIDDLIFVGVVGMIDPPRFGVKEAIEKTKKAGIRVVMITGDHRETALAIAKQIGLVNQDENKSYVEEEISKMSDKEFNEAVKNTSVFARVTPSTKLKIAEALQNQGNIVAMTGDGVNDAPAIKKADIGIAMGIIGTDVARESAEIVLVDDNFASIVSAIEEGRIVFTNTRQSGTFIVTTNFAEHATILSTIFLGLELPLLPTQILWLNLVTDGVTGGALAAEPGHGDSLSEPPRKAGEDILSKKTMPFLILMVITMAISTLIVFRIFLPDSLDKARTGAFLVMAFTQLFNVLNMRSLRSSLFKIGILTNKYIVIALLVSVILQITAIYIPFFQRIFRFTPLGGLEITGIIILSSFVLWFGEAYKLIRNSGVIFKIYKGLKKYDRKRNRVAS